MEEPALTDSQKKGHPNTILKQAQSRLTGLESDIPLIMDSLAVLDDFEVISDLDQRDLLFARVSLMSQLFSKFSGSDEAISILTECTNDTILLTAFLDPDSTFLKAKQVIYDLQTDIVKGGVAEPGQKAIQAITSLPYSTSKLDGEILVKSIVQIRALNEATAFLKLYDQQKIEPGSDATPILVLLESMLDNGFNKQLILDTFHAIENDFQRFEGHRDIFDFLLFATYGIGLFVKPDASPALESISERLILFKGFTAAQFLGQQNVLNTAGQGNKIIADFNEMLAKDGYSEYAFNKAIVDLKSLPTTTDEELTHFNQSLEQVMAVGRQYAPLNYLEAIEITRIALIEMASIALNPTAPLSMLGFKRLVDQSLYKLKKDLAQGRSIAGAYTQYMMTFSKLAILVPDITDDNEELFNSTLKSMMVDGFQSLKDYIPEDKKELWPQINSMMEMAGGAIDINKMSPGQQELYLQRVDDQNERLIYAARSIPLSPLGQQIPTIQQFIELFIPLAGRFVKLTFDQDTEDQKEYERLIAQLDDTLRLLGSAYTHKQILEHQKFNLRRMALELGQFERREFIMLASPIFPSNEVAFDANMVFFSGSSIVSEKVAAACLELEMYVASRKTVDNYINGRWQQLRESGIAIFDYSAFKPSVADPAGDIDHSLEAEEKVLKDAGPIADIAYENGLAYVLGKPVIVIKGKAKSLPFDIDIDPLELTNSDSDVMNIQFAIQTSLYGVSRAMKGSVLKETIDYVKTNFAGNKKAANVLTVLDTTNDATCVRLAIEAALERMDHVNQLLVTPAFPGNYPKLNEKSVFHVTAFRPWSKMTEQVLKETCVKNNLRYKIGYERLDPDIMVSIFEDISEASFIVADITNLNPNAVLELAMAQALGRPVLILTQNKSLRKYFKAIQKSRTHHYSTDTPKKQMVKLFEDFFDGKE